MTSAAYASMAYWFYRWDWGESVAIDGLQVAGRLLDNRGICDFVSRELAAWVERSRAGEPVNPMGPALALVDQLESGDDANLDSLASWGMLDRLVQEIVEASEPLGAIAPERDGRMVFVDSLYGVPEFLVRYADARGDGELLAAAIEFTIGHCSKLQRPDGLFAHFASLDDPAGPLIPWGRGNGWAALGLSRLEAALGARAPATLAERFTGFMEALRDRQAPDGSWRNLIDDKHSYPEASTTALVTAAMTGAVQAGVLGPDYREAADAGWDAIKDRIDANGHLSGVSYRPGVNSDPLRYEHTPIVGSYPWGQGPYLLAAAQRLLADAGAMHAPHVDDA